MTWKTTAPEPSRRRQAARTAVPRPMRQLLLALALPLTLLLASGGCYKVHHLGERTGQAFDEVFRRQALAGAKSAAADDHQMEAELATEAVKRMTKPAASNVGPRLEPQVISIK